MSQREGDGCQGGFLKAVVPGWVWKDSSGFTLLSAVGRESYEAWNYVRGWHVGFLGHKGREMGPCELNERASATSRFPLPGFLPLWQECVGSKACSGHVVLPSGFTGEVK